MSSITKVLDYTSKIVVTCISALLIACEPLIFGGISGLGGSSAVSFAQCSNGSPADLSGACRNSSPTPGALEVVGSQITSAASINITTTPLQNADASVLSISWPPYQGSASGYFVYYGPTFYTANTLASDLPIGTANFNAVGPTVSYQPTMDLGLSPGDPVCFRILAYDSARVPYTWSQVQCTAV